MISSDVCMMFVRILLYVVQSIYHRLCNIHV